MGYEMVMMREGLGPPPQEEDLGLQKIFEIIYDVQICRFCCILTAIKNLAIADNRVYWGRG